MNFNSLIKKANKIHLKNFSNEVSFEKCIFLSWYCNLNCKFCYRPTQKTSSLKARKKLSSILTETYLCKKFNWKLAFLTSGYGSYKQDEYFNIVNKVHNVYGEKIWLNLGLLRKKQLEEFNKDVKGIYASIETINEDVQKEICPLKPIKPYIKMLNNANGYKKALAIVIGLGENIKDIEKLHKITEENKIDKISFYALTPIKGTMFSKGPESKYYATWIAKTRINFPDLEIVAGAWLDRVNDISLLLKAGANSITKFPIIRKFNSQQTKEIENQVKKANRKLNCNITKIPEINLNEIDEFDLDNNLKQEIKEKTKLYLKAMR